MMQSNRDLSVQMGASVTNQSIQIDIPVFHNMEMQTTQ